MRRIGAWILLVALAAPAEAAIQSSDTPVLSAAEIVERNVSARGGLEVWENIRTMVWVGHIESGNGAAVIPFILELKRPNKTRFEVKAQGARSVRGFDGLRGWKLSAGRNGEPQVQPYSVDELKFAQEASGIDGPLVDYRAKGIHVALDGVDEVEDRRAYRLELTFPSGARQRVWIDAENFLEIKHDRKADSLLTASSTVSVFYRDYRTIDGVQVPMTIETRSNLTNISAKMSIDRIVTNPELNDREFAQPNVPRQKRTTVTIGAEPEPPTLAASRSVPSFHRRISGPGSTLSDTSPAPSP